MKFTPTSLPDVLLIEPRVFGDERGFFMETFQEKVFSDAGIGEKFVQDNHSGSQKGTLRGLHYQVRQAQGKLVRVVAGEIFDVAVDLRRDSPTFGKWEGACLSAKNKHQLWIPEGFAHGFYVLSDWAEVVYKATDYYAPEWERTLLWNDPELKIKWPLVERVDLLISQKDSQGIRFKEAEVYEKETGRKE
jgi:dTDP-4-dehydrorhamnose 3,5-epimerase